jgi:hypothetical protein
MYDQATYDNAGQWAAKATDDELLHFHNQRRTEDSTAINMGGRGLIDEPYWWAARRVLRERGIDLPGMPSLA